MRVRDWSWRGIIEGTLICIQFSLFASIDNIPVSTHHTGPARSAASGYVCERASFQLAQQIGSTYA
jgi:hypothetical protein